jgi:hypothetical protein
MAFVPGFKYDGFISYRHLDDRGDGDSDGDESGWVTQLQRRLRVRVSEYLGAEAVLWRDEQRLDGNVDFPAELRASVESAAILIAVVSPGYATSTWCRREFEIFREHANRHGQWKIGSAFRVFRVVRTPLPGNRHHDIPMPDALGYEFFRLETDAPDRPTRYLPGSPEFEKVLERLAQDIAELLREMAAGMGPVDDVSTATGLSTAPTIYCTAQGLDLTASVATVACVMTTQPDALAQRVRQFCARLGLDPYFAGLPAVSKRLAGGRLRYADDDADVRSRAIDAMATWPFDAYVSFAAGSSLAGRAPADAFSTLLRGVLFDRLRSLTAVSGRILLSPELEALESALGVAVADYRADITRRDGVSDMPAWTMGVASARDPVVAIVDYVCVVTSRRLSAGPDTLDARQFRRFYPNKVRVLHDWQAARVYSRRHPFPETWPTSSPAATPVRE